MTPATQKRFRVIGIVLARNEDIFIRTAIENIVPACDEILVFDHGSSDGTVAIIKDLAARESKIEFLSIRSPEESHRAIEKFAGSATWIFAVDGDEIYDPGRTKEFCDRLRMGEFAEYFQLRGNVLHVDERSEGEYRGFLAPPSRPMTKMFNFSLLESWTDGFERLHGGKQVFKAPDQPVRRLAISDQYDFAESPFRCLHMVFLKRSSREKSDQGPRLNIADDVSARFGERWKRKIKKFLGLRLSSPGKLKNYRLGDKVTVVDPAFELGSPSRKKEN
ncbi:glycosyltransferase [Puniceicoccus vermicola]|uniref:Glycosyltransferase family 2 protein n=1 Tax=Puniceicoccus vermicola TaxID=388746 RepID=A0A7X1E337_9BACT|nr:glycosyltransferase [Puniceicoccus vermicola]MBC2601085.1 glycosyltransferase family 2 protein [Puniceicoccus vermicola]